MKRVISLTLAILLLTTMVSVQFAFATETQLPILSGVSSSNYSSSYTASNAFDGSNGTMWISSYTPPENQASEYLSFNLGASSVTKVVLTPRADGVGFPKIFKFQSSSDGINFSDIPSASYDVTGRTITTDQTYTFSQAVETNYIRLFVTKKGADGWDVVQLVEMKVFGSASIVAPTTVIGIESATASMYQETYSADKAFDRNAGSLWISKYKETAASAESLTYHLICSADVKKVTLTPRGDGVGYPITFKFQYSNDGINYTDIPNASYDTTGQTITTAQTYEFSQSVTTKYIRLYVSKLFELSADYYCVQLAEMAVYGTLNSNETHINIESAVSTSIQYPQYAPQYGVGDAFDDNNASMWIAGYTQSATVPENLDITLPSKCDVTKVILTPPSNGIGYPQKFKFQSSNDGANWTDIAGASYDVTGQPLNSIVTDQTYTFSQPLNTKYVRLNVTQKAPEGWYTVKLAEVKVYGHLPSYTNISFANLTKTTATSATENNKYSDSYPATNLIDNNSGTRWITSSNFKNPTATIEFGSVQGIGAVELTDRGDKVTYPQSFKFQYSTDGTNWIDAPGGAYFEQPVPAQVKNIYYFSSVVRAKYIRLFIIKIGQYGNVDLAGMDAYANTLPTASSQQLIGDMSVGRPLTTSFTFADVDGDTNNSNIEWYFDDNASGYDGSFFMSGRAIIGADYWLIGKYIYAKIIPNDGKESGTPVFTSYTSVVLPVSFKAYNVVGSRKITNVLPGKTVSEFSDSQNVTLYNSSALTLKNSTTVLNSSDKVTTGTNIEVVSGGNTLETYTIIIYGDVVGNGSIDINDLAAIKQHLIKNNLLSGDALLAGDTSAKGSITISDLIAVKKAVLGIASINQNK